MLLARRKRILLDDPGINVRLCWYAPGEVMTAHHHGHGQVSVLLSGAFREIGDARCVDNLTGQIGYKAAGFVHENLYGETGALILSVNVCDASLPDATAWSWQAAPRTEWEIVRRIMTADGDAEIIRDGARDIVAGFADRTAMDRLPPAWARQLRDKLLSGEKTDLDAAAREYGIHRVHLSRGFRKWFGTPPSVFALRCRMSRAVKALIAGESAAGAAACAGFADQSHFTRTLRRETGFTPARLSRLLAA
jgi:AraC family transcriptional regulator